MINKEDILFENIKYIDKGQNFAYFGWEYEHIGSFDSFHFIADSYKQAANIIYQHISNSISNNLIIDSLIYPFMFCYRHSIELRLKAFCIRDFYRLKELDSGIKQQKDLLQKNHDLDSLWKILKKELVFIKDNYEEFDFDIDALESYIDQIHKFDRSSMNMRYPTNKDLTPNKTAMKLDVQYLNDRINSLLNEIDRLYDYIGNINKIDNIVSNNEYNLSVFYKKIIENREIILSVIDLCNRDEDNNIKEITIYNIISNPKYYKKDVYNYIYSLSSEQKILLEVLFYIGRDYRNQKWIKSIEEKKKQILSICCMHMDQHNLKWDDKYVDDNINITSKKESVIKENLEYSLHLLNLCNFK